jgi:hypothetical protein
MDSDDDSDKDFRVKRSEKRQLSRLKKRKDEFLLDEDDLILIEDNRKDSTQRNKSDAGKLLLALTSRQLTPIFWGNYRG